MEDIKIDGIPVQDYGRPTSRTVYPSNYENMEDIKEKTADEIIEYIKLCKKSGMDKSRAEAIEKLIEEKGKYKYLYQKALDNTIKSDRELIKFKNTIREIKVKAEIEAFYGLGNVIDDLNKLLGDDK